jgi:PknH-like protein
MGRRAPVFAVCVAITLGALTTGCTSTVNGAAVKPKSSVPADDVPLIEESALDGLMLSNSELNMVAGVDLESFYSSEEMNDNADLVSDEDCLGAVYPGEEVAYHGSGWSAVRDELLLEQGSVDDSRVVEQTLVLFDTRNAAVEFFDKSNDLWHECAKADDVSVEEGPWVPSDVQNASERLITMDAELSGTISGICQHAIGVVSNLVVEGFACDPAGNDNAETIANKILDNAADQ